MANQPEKIATPTESSASTSAAFAVLAYEGVAKTPTELGRFASEAAARQHGDWLVSVKGCPVVRYEIKRY